MRINIASIKENRGASVRNAAVEPIDVALPGGVHLEGPVNIEAAATNAGDAFHVAGLAKARYQASCDRCLSAYDASLEAEFEADFVRSSARPGHEPVDDPDSALRPFTGDEIDIDPVVQEALLLAVPMKFLCRADCQGLCPKCGRRRSEGQCQCSDESYNPKFEALRKLLGKEEV